MLGVKKLHMLIFRQFALLFIGAFFIALFVLMMQFVWRYIDTLIGKGLSVDVLAQFFWYMALMMVPQALPLAILLSSLITYGNFGETFELTATKAAGISLMRTLKPLAVVVFLVSVGSFYFQNNIGPASNDKMAQLLVAMKQKSPELEIPEGIFYDGIPGCNLYVQHKDLDSGMLYGIMIYRMTNSFEDAAIILADSGQLQSTAEKKHLLLNLYSGEWFENMRSQELAGSASVPYRRETFWRKTIVLDFDADLNLGDGSGFSQRAQAKGLGKIARDMDSLAFHYDSIGHTYYREAQQAYFGLDRVSKTDSQRIAKTVTSNPVNVDSLYEALPADKKKAAVNYALTSVQQAVSDLSFKSVVTADGDKQLRQHMIEAINKFTLALSCLIFFFIGAPLGAIIRKGGLGLPIVVSVLVYIVFYILDNTGFRMSRDGMWSVWFGKLLATAVLTPIAIFITYKANKDSAVFNLEAYRDLAMRMLGMRRKRNVMGKEVIIQDPDYARDKEQLLLITADARRYGEQHRLASPPNVIRTFFKYQPDHEIENLHDQLEEVIEDLGNTRDKVVISQLSHYPLLIVKAHTRPFERRWMNIAAFVIVPLGIFFYLRMWRFRRRLQRDLDIIIKTNGVIVKRIEDKKL
ncbi:MAG: LptF/LptG family permease [Prevotella sp.]|nr:LptF/LptG family permease [Prevotella sp.]